MPGDRMLLRVTLFAAMGLLACSHADRGGDSRVDIVDRDTAVTDSLGEDRPGPVDADIECVSIVCDFTVQVGGDGPALPGDASVPVQSILFLEDTSHDVSSGSGEIQKRAWSVLKPPASVHAFRPDDSYVSPTFTPDVVGEYTIRLQVQDGTGCAASCNRRIRAVPMPGCYVQLTWDVAADPDPTGTCPPSGTCHADLDLHVAHPFATGDALAADGSPYGYFDDTYDCFWANPHPTWEPTCIDDTACCPSLLSTDADAHSPSGSEAWSLERPRTDACYRVGVHYYADDGPGRATPTVSVFFDGVADPVYQRTLSSGLIPFDLWDVGRVCCSDPSTPFIEFDGDAGEPVVVPLFPAPF